jgi:hypothetical protein
MIVPLWDPNKREWTTTHTDLVTHRRGGRLIVTAGHFHGPRSYNEGYVPRDKIKHGGLLRFLRKLRRNE